MDKPYFVHESSYVDEPVSIGKGTNIWHFCHISKGARIGRNCKFGQNVFVGSTVVIGDGVKIQNNVSVYDGVILEDYVFCGPSMVFTNIVNPRSAFPRNTPDHYLKTLVRHHASIGANATVVCGNTIGCHSFIGAGAVVTKDVPGYALVTGVPARVRGWMCECGIRLKVMDGEVSCDECGREYSIGPDGVRRRD